MINIKTREEIEILREGGKILADILNQLKKKVAPGISTGELEDLACELIERAGGKPSFKGYDPGLRNRYFPTALCASINDEIVHSPAYPSRKLKEGDIIGLDIGMEYPVGSARKSGPVNRYSESGGYFTDMAITVGVGKVSDVARRLMETTRRALEAGIKAVAPGNKLSDIGRAIQDRAEAEGFSVVRELVGHGVGHLVHEEPRVFNYVPDEREGGYFKDIVLKPGMVLAIEPMINEGGWAIKQDRKNGFCFKTRDGKMSAHFEHTIAVAEKGKIIITTL